MKILGMAYSSHDQSICLLENNTIIYHIEVERINRVKHNWFGCLPENKLKSQLEFEKIAKFFIEQENPDIIATSFFNFNNTGNIIPKEILNYKKNFIDDYNWHYTYKKNNVLYYVTDHHFCHAALSEMTSPFEDCDILAYDGGGENYYSIFIDKNNNLISNPLRVGLFWGYITIRSFGKLQSGKLMGLSAYGNINKEYLKHFYNETSDFWNSFNFKDIDKLKDLAATLQFWSIETTCNYLEKNKTSENLCISGGVGLNGYINQAIIERGIYKNVYIPPACSDEGNSIGAALHALKNIQGTKRVVSDLRYLGLDYDINNIKIPHGVKALNLEYKEIYPYIAKEIFTNKIVAWYQGRSESGPRALGNRSIFCNPINPEMKDYLNDRVKHRESFRPFAPIILEEEVINWFEKIEKEPYMLKIPKYKKGMGEKVPAVCHIDYTGRVQTITSSDIHAYNLIKEFQKITGVPMLLNTSFNDNEPLVETPEDAIKTFINTKIDILVLKNIVLIK